jgi:hypothetical protein
MGVRRCRTTDAPGIVGKALYIIGIRTLHIPKK